MNTIQLKQLAGKPLTQAERSGMFSLAFACPLEAGNAVYRARGVLSKTRHYAFDDTANCASPTVSARQGSEDSESSDSERSRSDFETVTNDWLVYPNPARRRLWIAGKNAIELESIQLYNGFGQPVPCLLVNADARVEVQLPADLPAGVYFLRLQLRDGKILTRKVILQS